MFKNLIYDTTLSAVSIIKAMTGANVVIKGLDNVNLETTNIFIANHFSRIETLLIANLIYKKSNVKVRALADHSIFVDKTKEYFKKIGLVDTADEKRDIIILNDLIQGKNNWLIFPEGKMIKNKKSVYSHTGASLLAIQAYLLREEYKIISHDSEKIKQFKQDNDIYENTVFSNKEINICPISVNYINLRHDKNYLSNALKTDIPRLNEEIAIESNMLLHSDIIVNILQPVSIREYIKKYNIDNIIQDKKFILDNIRVALIKETMKNVHRNISISIEHIVALLLWFYPKREISLTNFRSMIFCLSSLIRSKNYNLHSSIENELLELAIDEPYEPLEKVLHLAKKQNIIKVYKNYIKIFKNQYEENYEFHTIRIKNTIKVVLNEALSVKGLSTLAKKTIILNDKDMKNIIAKNLINYDKFLYNQECKKSNDIKIKIKQTNAQAKLLKGTKKIGIVLSHGFSSSPNEVARLARKLNKMGYFVYMTRTSGHSIDAELLSKTKWQDWEYSYNVGYGILKASCDDIILAGFSMGGLLALLSASKKPNIKGVIAISPALKTKDFRVNKIMLGTTVLFNELISTPNSLSTEYVDNEPEYPDFNYHKHYITSIKELNSLMNECEENLSKIKCPTLIVSNEIDPIISPQSAITINDKISSNIKMTYSLSSKRHVIVNNEKLNEVFNSINKFIGVIK